MKHFTIICLIIAPLLNTLTAQTARDKARVDSTYSTPSEANAKSSLLKSEDIKSHSDSCKSFFTPSLIVDNNTFVYSNHLGNDIGKFPIYSVRMPQYKGGVMRPVGQVNARTGGGGMKGTGAGSSEGRVGSIIFLCLIAFSALSQ